MCLHTKTVRGSLAHSFLKKNSALKTLEIGLAITWTDKFSRIPWGQMNLHCLEYGIGIETYESKISSCK